jgi:predicted PurR-regulated permease PerM
MIGHKNYGLWIIVLLVGVLTFMLLSSYWQYLIFAIIFALLFYKPYKKLERRMHPNLAATAIILVILVLLVIPTMYVLVNVVNQLPAAYSGLVAAIEKPAVVKALGSSADEVHALTADAGSRLRTNLVENVGGYLNQVTNILLGLFLMFATIFFMLRDGDRMYSFVLFTLPVRKHNTHQFAAKMHTIVNAVLMGQLVTAFVQGVLAGILFLFLGVPNPLLWGVVTFVLSIIPMMGPFLVYVPAGIFLMLEDRFVAGLVMLIVGTLVLSQIDNVIRPYIAHRTAQIHPLTVIIGVVCGLKLWGLIGFILGPLVLAAFLALYEFSMTGDEAVLTKEHKPGKHWAEK